VTGALSGDVLDSSGGITRTIQIGRRRFNGK
jgi:hypothetical protein